MATSLRRDLSERDARIEAETSHSCSCLVACEVDPTEARVTPASPTASVGATRSPRITTRCGCDPGFARLRHEAAYRVRDGAERGFARSLCQDPVRVHRAALVGDQSAKEVSAFD